MIDMETFANYDRWRLELTPTGAFECKVWLEGWEPYAWGLGDTIELAIERALEWARVRETQIVDPLYPKY
jgi:hypothetical protein